MAELVKNIISKNKFEHLLRFKNTLTDTEKAQLEAYLEHKSKPVVKLPEGYFDEKPKLKLENIPTDFLKKEFVKQWEFNEGKKLIINEQNKEIYKIMVQYFAKNKAFENNALVSNVPDLDKGLLLIGGVGCGKTSMMNAFKGVGDRIYQKYQDTFMYFLVKSCNGLVREFEGIEGHREKENFFKSNITPVIYFDDFGTENIASNYGKVNLMKEILEERYLHKKKCYLTTNLSISEINEKYGFRVLDRINEMFNVIEMPGESFRK